MPSSSLYERVLAAVGGGAALPAPKPPRPSASVVLWRRTERGLEAFWIQRSPALAFMGGWYAFPGGGLSREDAATAVAGLPRGADGTVTAAAMPETLAEDLGPNSINGAPPHVVPGILACALRELLEETGVLPVPELSAGGGDAASLEARLAAARSALVEGGRPFAEAVAEQGLVLDAGRLVFAGRWLTPPLGPMRFDNRFFLLEWPAELPVQPLVVPGEAVAGEWVAPGVGVARWERGELLTAPPILHILRVLGEEGPEAGLGRLREPREANLGPYRRVEFRPGVLMLPLKTATLPPALHTNAFLLGRRELVLVDPGSGDPAVIDRLEAVARAVEEQGGRVSAIWLTHHHPDHVGGVAALRERLRVPVCAHPATAERLAGAARPVPVDRPLEDGQILVLAGEPPFPVQVVHTPGHARGHLCFLDLEGGSLLAGDMVSALSTIVVDPPEGDMDDYLASLAKLIELAPRTLFPAHGPPVKDAVAKLREFFDHRLWRERRILEEWQRGTRTAAGLRPLVYEEELPPMAHPLAERQIEAHLARLRRAGRLP